MATKNKSKTVVTKVVLAVNTRKKPQVKGKPRGVPFAKGNPRAWKPGQSGNPNGRPKGSGTKILSVAYSATLEQVVPDSLFATEAFRPWRDLRGLGFTFADLIALGQARSAALGDASNAREMREATEGKVADRQQFLGANGEPTDPAQPVAVNVNFVKPKAKR